MKKILAAIMLSATSLVATAQKYDFTINLYDENLTAEEMLRKSKAQRLGAILVGSAGTAVCVAGVLVWAEGYTSDYGWWESEDNSKMRAGEVMVIAGTVVALSSIPLFISSARNRKKANLILKNENVMISPRVSTGQILISAGIILKL